MSKAFKVDDPNQFRMKMSQYILRKVREISPDYFGNAPVNIEKSVYNYAINQCKQLRVVRKWNNESFITVYKDRLRSICINISHVYHGLVSNIFTYTDLSSMTHQQLYPKQWDELIKKKIDRDTSKYSTTSGANTDDFTCRCGSTECFAYQLQTRSADEPMTTFVTCTKCGKRWKC